MVRTSAKLRPASFSLTPVASGYGSFAAALQRSLLAVRKNQSDHGLLRRSICQ
jgi:hypothetical protein